ncbi:MAG: hypothetical protein J6J43_04240 [Oscillospiraceae bacterium]|nr:hypothetical protein [Oscillospiraceae bacterium]
MQQTLLINRHYPDEQDLSCCAQQPWQITLQVQEDTLILTRRLDDLKDLLDAVWVSSFRLPGTFPLYERVQFCFGRGTVQAQLCDTDGTPLCAMDLTQRPCPDSSSSLFVAMAEDPVLNDALEKGFSHFWKGVSLPFTGHRMTLDRCVLMTRFVGFPACFFDAIPFDRDTGIIHEDFRKQAAALHTPDDCDELLKGTTLPYVRSVRKAFFLHPGLLFYTQQCQQLYEILQNIDVFCEFLSSLSAFEVLSSIHDFPGVLEFYLDYGKDCGANALCRQLTLRPDTVNRLALQYCAMNEHRKKQLQTSWHQHGFWKECSCTLLNTEGSLSIPMSCVPSGICDTVIDGFAFLWLRSKQDYIRAGKDLDNCLVEWRRTGNPVVVVRKDMRTVAAIEVSGNNVCQALTYGNRHMEPDTPLFEAFGKWCDRHHLDLLLEDDDLPF